MFGSIGTSEIFLLLALALIIIGPKKLPELARTLGKGLAEFRRTSNEIKRTLTAELDEGALSGLDHHRMDREAAQRIRERTSSEALSRDRLEQSVPREYEEDNLEVGGTFSAASRAAEPPVPVESLTPVESTGPVDGTSSDNAASGQASDAGASSSAQISPVEGSSSSKKESEAEDAPLDVSRKGGTL